MVSSSIGSSLLSLGKKRKGDGEGDGGDRWSEGRAEADEAVEVLRRALDLAKAPATALGGDRGGGSPEGMGAGEEGGSSDDGDDRAAAARVARVLDTLSEAYARGGHWELARSETEGGGLVFLLKGVVEIGDGENK